MIGAMAAEWLKMRKRPAVWVLGLVLLAVLFTLGYFIGWILLSHPPANSQFPAGTKPSDFKVAYYPQNFVRQAIGFASTLGGAIVLILGVLAAGSQYGWDTWKTIFTQRPGRVTVWLGKVVITAVLVAIAVVLHYLVAATASVILATVDGVSYTWPAASDIARGMAATWLIWMMWACFGLLLSVLFKQSALAIGIGLVYLLAG